MDVRIHEQILVLNDQGGAVMDISNDVTATLRAQDHGHPPVVCFSIGAMNSEGMLSSNPHAGIHQTDVARTIDANGSNPAGYQGGDVVVQKKQEFLVESIGHDIRSTQFSRGGAAIP